MHSHIIKKLLLRFGITTALFGCETTGYQNRLSSELNLYTSGCNPLELSSEPDWLFIRCAIKNTSKSVTRVQFSPFIDENDPNFSIPDIKQLEALQKRLKLSNYVNLSYTGPLAADRPEAFIFGVVAALMLYTAGSENKKANLEGETPKDIQGESTAIFHFPLLKKQKVLPVEIRLKFFAPVAHIFNIPLIKDAATEARLRPTQ